MLICIGGVCVPYTAVVPIILLALKWVVVKLVRMGLLPKAIGDILQVSNTTTSSSGEALMTANGPSVVTNLDSEDLFRELVKDGKEKIVCKFTARYDSSRFLRRKTVLDENVPLSSPNFSQYFSLCLSWCKPCHKVQPFYESLSSHYATEAKFFTIDVDDFDVIAGQYSVSMMPTFLVLQGEKVLGRYSGSNELELQRFLKEQVGRSE